MEIVRQPISRRYSKHKSSSLYLAARSGIPDIFLSSLLNDNLFLEQSREF